MSKDTKNGAPKGKPKAKALKDDALNKVKGAALDVQKHKSWS